MKVRHIAEIGDHVVQYDPVELFNVSRAADEDDGGLDAAHAAMMEAMSEVDILIDTPEEDKAVADFVVAALHYCGVARVIIVCENEWVVR